MRTPTAFLIVTYLFGLHYTIHVRNASSNNTVEARIIERKKRANAFCLRIRKHLDQSYYAIAKLGTPPQEFRMLIDTGSDVHWVKSVNTRLPTTKLRGHYIPTASSTNRQLAKTFSVEYLEKRVEGLLSEDVLKLEGEVIPRFIFGQALEVHLGREEFFNGLLGLAFGSSVEPPHETLLDAMLRSGVISEAVFTLEYFGAADRAGQIIFGFVRESTYPEEIFYLPVVSYLHWIFNIDRIEVGARKVAYNVLTLLDTGAEFIVAPPEIASAINGRFPHLQIIDEMYIVDCALVRTFPPITFYVNDRYLRLSGTQYVVERTTSTGQYCASGVQALPDTPVLILGVAFLQHYYTVFDKQNERVGFGPKTH